MSALLGAVASVLARTLLKDLKPRDILGVNFLTMAVTLLVISPIFYSFHPSLEAFTLLVLVAFIDTLANYFFFKTFEQTEASVATPILSLAPVFTFLLSWLVLGDTVKLSTYVLSFLILAGIVAFSADFKNFSKFRTQTLQPAIISSVLFGISAVPSKYLLSTLHAINPPTLYMFRAALIAIFALLFFNFPLSNISAKHYRLIFFRGLFVIGQWVLLYFALAKGNAGVTVILANITPVFVFILAAVFLREKPTVKKVLASVLVLCRLRKTIIHLKIKNG